MIYGAIFGAVFFGLLTCLTPRPRNRRGDRLRRFLVLSHPEWRLRL